MQIFRNLVEITLMLLAVTLLCLFCCYAWPEDRYGIAGWVSAVGTIGAIIGAFLIFAAQMESGRAKDRSLARLAAAGFVHSATTIHSMVRSAAIRYSYGAGDKVDIDDFEGIPEMLAFLPMITSDTLIHLSTIPNGCAENLAAVEGILAHLRRYIPTTLAQDDLMNRPDFRLMLARNTGGILLGAERLMECALVELHEFLEREPPTFQPHP